MSYEKEGVTMRAVWLLRDEPDNYQASRQAAYADPEQEDTSLQVQADRPIAHYPAFATLEDEDDFWEIPIRLTP